MKYKSTKFILLLFVMIIISSCSGINNLSSEDNALESNNFKNKIQSTTNRDILPNAIHGGVNIGLYNTNGKIETEYNFNIKKNESINKFISIGNMIDSDRIYKLLLFIDYKQSSFKVDNHKPKIDYTFKIKSNESVQIPITIDSLKEGLHSILFAIVKYPDIKKLDDEFRKNTDSNNILFLRFSATVNNDNSPKIDYNKFGQFKKSAIVDGVFISKEDNYRRWLSEEINKDGKLDYYIKVGNTSNIKSRTYALIMLYDWKQINIEPQNDVLYYKINTGNQVSIKSTMDTKNKGVHDLAAILVHYPFQKCTLKNREVETAIRIGINVK